MYTFKGDKDTGRWAKRKFTVVVPKLAEQINFGREEASDSGGDGVVTYNSKPVGRWYNRTMPLATGRPSPMESMHGPCFKPGWRGAALRVRGRPPTGP